MLEMDTEIEEHKQTTAEVRAALAVETEEKLKTQAELNRQRLQLEIVVDTVAHFTPGENAHMIDKRGVVNFQPGVTEVSSGTDL